MKTGLLDTRDENSKRAFYSVLKDLKPDEYIYSIKKNRSVRSVSQNNFYWAVIQLYAIHTGHTQKEIDGMFRMDRHFEIVEYPKSGRREKIPKDTSDLKTDEFTFLCNNLLQWGRENFPEVIVPRKEDLTYVQWMNISNEYDRVNQG